MAQISDTLPQCDEPHRHKPLNAPPAANTAVHRPDRLEALLFDERRRRDEGEQGSAMNEDQRALLPMALALARLAAQRSVLSTMGA
ncbi:hypothetical protein [Caulobacter sp. FWC2]|uniref:hypothetical protein n=1 Tax=Caulobacter sp. FWC2 TaxID=69664 RepID=UPI000C155592|nr:hypothetical protein [Caulobacter sp. FWC2]